jgi:hypothetical protein
VSVVPTWVVKPELLKIFTEYFWLTAAFEDAAQATLTDAALAPPVTVTPVGAVS